MAQIARCPFCTKSFRIEGTPWTAPNAEALALVLAHAASCPKTIERLRFRTGARLADDVTAQGRAAHDIVTADWRLRALVAKLNPAVKCGAKCTDAKGHVCECSCGGKNHGTGSVLAVA